MSGRSELFLFSPALPQIVTDSAYFSEITPQHSLGGGSTTITFNVLSSEQEYIDANDTLLEITFEVKKGTNADLDDASTHRLVNHAMAALFSDVKLLLNNVVIEGGSSTYPYKAVIENMFNFDETTRVLQLRSAGYAPKDDDRKAMIAKSKHCTLIGALRLDFFNQPQYLLPGVDMKLIMQTHKSKFAIEGIPAGQNPSINFLSAKLHVRRVRVNPSVLLAHQTTLEKTNAVYYYDSGKVISYAIPVGTINHTYEPLFPRSILPKLVIVGLVKSIAYSANDSSTSPFKFEPFGVKSVGLYYNGQCIPYAQPYEINEWSTSGALTTYVKSIIHGVQHMNKNTNNGIDLDSFIKGPNTFFTFNTTSDFDFRNRQMVKDASLRLDLKFEKGLVEAINVVVFGIFDCEIQITKDKTVIPDPNVF